MARHLRRWQGLRPATAAVTAAALGFAGVVLSASSAAAAPPIAQVPQVSLAYTDVRTPATSYPQPTGDLPLGSWLDGQGATHESRVYASFDLAGFAAKDTAKHVVTASFLFGESSAASYVQRSVEVWQTATPTAPVTWRRAPAEKQLLGTVVTTAAGPASYLHLDLTSAAAAAAASGRHTLSVELRLPDADEKNTALGRRLNPGMTLYASSNTPPGAPTELFSQAYACAAKAPYPYLPSLTPPLTAMLHDTDPGDQYLTGHYAVWPVEHPEQRTEFTQDSMLRDYGRSANVPTGLLADGGTYAWQVRGGDGTDLSAWSKPCTFHVDTTLPSAAPVVTSANYPVDRTTPGGVPGQFTLGANGVPDVAGYQFSWSQDFPVLGWSTDPNGVPQRTDPYTLPGFVRASRLGGPVKLTLTPPDQGPQTLYVRSLDRAFNPSPATSYRFFVPNTMPAVTGLPAAPRLGTPFTLHLAPNAGLPSVDSYTVQLNNDTPQTVTAAPDGTASVTLTLAYAGGNTITVRSHSPNGWTSSSNRLFAFVDTAPGVTSDIYPEDTGTTVNAGGVGVTGVFSFAPKVPNVVSYTYSFDFGNETTVAAGTDGTAQASWAPDASGQHTLSVYATDRDGKTYDTYYYSFDVN
ncbi:hypothetical protein GCM10009760_24680 [Kitasatospora kazusensis]|uniref:DNRLRE domain-containing protein n=1 Tax=Kitasatospora kazusensis TaxID=407974 RepID=A0ABN2ZEH6_9ACTN